MSKFALHLLALYLLAVNIPIARADSLSHLGQPVGNLVTLKYTSLDRKHGHTTPYLITPEGESKPFKLPGGNVLVITDVEWRVTSEYYDTTRTDGTTVALEMLNNGSVVYVSDPVVVKNGNAGSHANLTAGIVVSDPHVELKLATNVPGNNKGPNKNKIRLNIHFVAEGDAFAILHGYFLPAASPSSAARSPKMGDPAQAETQSK